MATRSEHEMRPDRSLSSLCDPARLAALAESGLTEASDADMEHFARRVQTGLGVPVALATLVQADRQVFPGMIGLSEPWAGRRSTPLSHSFCQHVVTTAAPLVIRDARLDPLVRDNLAIPDLGVVAYAGVPLTDSDGNVLGSLCAIDVVPRDWTARELTTLTELARACSTELRLRLARHHTDRERARTDELHHLLRASLERTQLLLTASVALTDTRDVTDIRLRITDMVSGSLKPSYVGLVIATADGELRRVADPDTPFGADGRWQRFPLDTPLPTARAVRERRMVLYADREAFDLDHGPEARQVYRALDLHAIVCAPLLNVHDVLGVLVFGWDQPRVVDGDERAIIATIADYTTRALERAQFLQNRITVAHRLQEAMLTELPEVDGLTMAARYVPADADEHVGGDWYDAISVPSDDQMLVVAVGDITGHDIGAAALMGQVRNMLRQAAWDRPDGTPSAVVTSLEQACQHLGVDAHGTLLQAHLRPHRDGTGRWSMTWTNAGHPPPIVLDAAGSTTMPTGHDMLFGYPNLNPRARADHHVTLEPGTVVVLYTDGLIERRGVDLDESTARLRALLTELHGRSPQQIVDTVVEVLAGDRAEDDVVVLAVRVDEPSPGGRPPGNDGDRIR